MADPMTLDDYFQTDAGQQLQIDMAGMPDGARSDMMAQLQNAADAGSLTEDFNTDGMFLGSENADAARQDASADLAQQAQDAQAGNWDAVQTDAQNAAYSMEEAQSDGGTVDDSQIVQAQTDDANAGWAEYHQEIGDADSTTAAAYAASGDTDTAQMYADSAASQDTTAADYGATADAGGIYADHAVDATSAETTTADPGADASAT